MFTTYKPSFCQQCPFCKFLRFHFWALTLYVTWAKKKKTIQESPRPQLSYCWEPVAARIIGWHGSHPPDEESTEQRGYSKAETKTDRQTGMREERKMVDNYRETCKKYIFIKLVFQSQRSRIYQFSTGKCLLGYWKGLNVCLFFYQREETWNVALRAGWLIFLLYVTLVIYCVPRVTNLVFTPFLEL